MDDYYSFAAFFSQIGRKESEDYRETIVFNSGGGKVGHPLGGRVMEPKFLGGPKADCHGKDRRQVLADWLTAYPIIPSSPPAWATASGPISSASASSNRSMTCTSAIRPSTPLYQTLGRKLVEYKYDFKRLVRDLCLSQTYQRATQTNAGDRGNQGRKLHPRPGAAESSLCSAGWG